MQNIAHACHGHTHSSFELGCVFRTEGYKLVVTLLEVSGREERVEALHLPTGPLKTRSGLKPVPRCEHSTYQPIVPSDLATVPSG